MNPSAIAFRVKTWLSSTWHIKVPDQWLEACISWIQQENGSSLSQAEINKQVYEQWLLTDLRDLEYAILPAGILESLKIELNGFYALQVDSLVDVSQPAYSQLQKLRGRDNVNEQVTAATQASQKPWEAKPTRMLMLQLTDGTQQIQGMEYRPLPVLNANLSPGTKILLQGTIVCRLGVLLLKPENLKVLGGEVEALVEEYTQDKVLSRLIGAEINPLPQRPAVQEQIATGSMDDIGQAVGPSDEDLLASLDENSEFTINNATAPESGYYSRNDDSSYVSRVSYLNRQQTPESGFEQGSSTVLTPTTQADVREMFEEEYDLDDDLFLEEEIQRELEEMSMDQVNTTSRSQDFPTAFNSSAPSVSRKCDNKVISKHDLDNTPFTYLSAVLSNKISGIQCVKLKSFIVTLNGNLTNSGGRWNIKAKISDGTGYLDVEFSNDVLTKLIGFSVTEMKSMKKDPSQQSVLMKGLQKCQRELTDFCGIMTVSYNPTKSEASVIALQDINKEIMDSLRRRISR
ncbi:recQ-mediated genome instability protein 1 isoform 1-T2 [Discoglossus pictus]